MKRHFKPFFAGAILILYTGMMLSGQSLHALMGCEHDHGAAGRVESRAPGEQSLAVVAGEPDLHDADGCPICQFQAHGQLAPSLATSELRRLVVAVAPLSTPLIFAGGVAILYSPRGPPAA
jgi:hypothetical protein